MLSIWLTFENHVSRRMPPTEARDWRGNLPRDQPDY